MFIMNGFFIFWSIVESVEDPFAAFGKEIVFDEIPSEVEQV